MAKREYLSNARDADVERSAEDIRQDIAKGAENISQTLEQIDERIQEKLDWREYVKDSPYLALGAAAGIGYLASRLLKMRTTPMERIMDSIAGEVRQSLGGLLARAAGPSLIKVTLLGIATKVAADLIKNTTSTALASAASKPRPTTVRGASIRTRADSRKIIKIKS
jgi:ElaB/YqjD/DUF883 family membrane-anchored ribosome-binding protein